MAEPVTVYNFEVADFHTYFVGSISVLVHNKGCGNTPQETPQAAVSSSSGSQGVDIHLKIRDDWTEEQIADAIKKAEQLTNATTIVTTPSGDSRNRSAIQQFVQQFGKTAGNDVDHIVDLQLGGQNDISNLQLLDSSVNRSFGSQIMHAIHSQELADGTVVNRFIIDNLP